MLKWIKNSKGSKNNKSSKYRGVTFNKGYYQANILFSQYDKNGKRKQVRYVIGQYKTEKEAMSARVKFILSLF